MNDEASTACHFPGCCRPIHARKVCINHYIEATRLIAAGKTTWAELVAFGIVAAARPQRKQGKSIKARLKESRAAAAAVSFVQPILASCVDMLPGH